MRAAVVRGRLATGSRSFWISRRGRLGGRSQNSTAISRSERRKKPHKASLFAGSNPENFPIIVPLLNGGYRRGFSANPNRRSKWIKGVCPDAEPAKTRPD